MKLFMQDAKRGQARAPIRQHTSFFRKWGARLLIAGTLSAAPNITLLPATVNARTQQAVLEEQALESNTKKEEHKSEEVWFTNDKTVALLKMLGGHELAKSIAMPTIKKIKACYYSKYGEKLPMNKKIELYAYLILGEGNAELIAAKLGGCVSVSELENSREKVKIKIELAEKKELETRARLAENRKKQELKQKLREERELKRKTEEYEKAKERKESLSNRILNIGELVFLAFSPEMIIFTIPIIFLALTVIGAVVWVVKKLFKND